MKISIAMCTYNGEIYIEEQLKSIVSQTKQIDELIIVDDCSTDRTCNIIEQFKDKLPIQLVINKNNLGVRESFDKCILACSGDIIFTADQDDIWEKNKIQVMYETFQNNSNCMLAFSDATVVDSELNIIANSGWDALCLDKCGIMYDNVSQQKLINAIAYQPVVFGNMMALRGDFARKIFPMSHINGFMHDNWAAMCAPIYGGIVMVNKKLVKYRRHDKNVSSSMGYDMSEDGKTAYHIGRVLWFIRENYEKLDSFLKNVENKGIVLPQEYKVHIEKYINTFSTMNSYKNLSSIKKLLYLICFMNRKDIYEKFNLKKKDILKYMLLQCKYQKFSKKGSCSKSKSDYT